MSVSNSSNSPAGSTVAAGGKVSAINLFFICFVVGAVLCAAFTDRMEAVNKASFESAKRAVTLALELVGAMAFWLGMMRVLEAGGLMYSVANRLRPVMRRLFPDVPPEHPAMGAMLLNISANMLGIGNAATPFGIKAMTELNRLNPLPGTATNAMCLFLAINTSSVTLLPLGVINLRAAAGAIDPAAIFLPTLIATLCSTTVGAVIAMTLGSADTRYKREVERAGQVVQDVPTDDGSADSQIDQSAVSGGDYTHLRQVASPPHQLWGRVVLLLFALGVCYQGYYAALGGQLGVFLRDRLMSFWLMPGLILLIICYGWINGVKVYEAVTEGAKQGFETAVRIIPFLVTMFVAISMFQESGAMTILASVIEPITSLIGMPTATLPVALVRSLSGSGAFALVGSLVKADPNSYESFVASTMMGSHDTTFYILAVYFGAVGVVRIRHALVAGIAADFTGVVTSSLICRLFWQ